MKKILFVFITAGLMLGLLPRQVFAQKPQVTVTGTVVNEKNESIPGATVAVKGTTTGTITSTDGTFNVKAASDAVLSISFIGFKTIEVPVNGKTNLKITLQEDNKLMDEVVVVGYGTQRRVNLTGAVGTVDVAKMVGSRPVTDLARGLQGSSPGLLITTSSGNIGTSPEIHIRGLQGSINAESKPLILLDNVEIPNIMMINPADIESVSVLKDAASASIYDARGTWGVILLTSKKGAKGKVNVSYDNSFAWSAPMNTPEIAEGADGAEYMLKQYRRTAPNTTSFNVLGAYYDDLSVQKMRQWKQLYGGQDLGNAMVEGRDYEFRAGQVYYYRPWDIDNLFLNNSSPQMKHNLSISGGNDKTTYYICENIQICF
jgi:TonB-dependent SusC/RagA subfamily outer membrane receptor